MKKWLLAVAVAAVVLIPHMVKAASEWEQRKTFVAIVDKDGVQRVDMVGGQYFFDPFKVVVKVNVPVVLSVSKKSRFVPHNIRMDSPEAGLEFNVDMSREPKTIEFTPTKTGTYPFFCDKKLLFLKSHREKGMEGVLEVIE